jgi:pyruvate-formate lyase
MSDKIQTGQLAKSNDGRNFIQTNYTPYLDTKAFYMSHKRTLKLLKKLNNL